KCQMSNVATLPIFVDAARFSARPDEVAVREIRARYAQFGRLILMVGRLAQEKNIALAIEAMRDVVKAHPRTGFIVVGDGSEKSRYQLPVTSYQLQNNVIFESSAADLAPYYHAADIFLHTSNYEGYGMVLVEAAAAGLPIVTTDVGIVGDILRDGESAFVCPVGDRACIRERLLRLLGDETLQIRLGSAAQEAVMRHAVSKEEYVRKYQETWERCATSRVLEKNDENMDYTGVIIEESLENKDVLKEVHISSTKIEEVTAEHKTPWIKQWTLHTVKISENQADSVAGKISKALDRKHPWYADFKNNASHFVIFRDKFFKVDRSKKEQYDDVARFGVSLGIPDYQLDFSPQVKEWER
ncbi:MAG: glycosyltransferase family 4 protein, partial [Patescibacteria group bacterium]|nr:glycosyltransferase family 4 protein [Patescibacteria group bacterium]